MSKGSRNADVANEALALVRAKGGALYALHIYPWLSAFARKLRPLGRSLRRLDQEVVPVGSLLTVAWREVIESKPIRLVALGKSHGNVRHNELAVLAKAAASVRSGAEIVEIGTFDGRTALNLALNAPDGTHVFTLDLPAGAETTFAPARTEREFIEKPRPGSRFQNYAGAWSSCRARIVQLIGDSAAFDWSPHFGKAALVFVDGSHAYEYALHDSEIAFRLVAQNGMIIWHDYGVWKGITQALDEIEAACQLGLRRIRGTSLVFWRKSA